MQRSRSLVVLSLVIPVLAACAAEAGSMPTQADRLAARDIELSLELPEQGFQVSTVAASSSLVMSFEPARSCSSPGPQRIRFTSAASRPR